ncbi:MAG: nucleoside hydrolase, partial [Deltaproteobacteria bacterium]|nr:nucleoside hydrolase [Deltaproteobacteria bacterium]
ALLLALRSPELEVTAVTTVSGNVPVDMATRNVFRVLSFFPPSRRPRVAMGASKPLQKQPVYAFSIHGEDGLGGLGRYMDSSGRPRYPEPPGNPCDRSGVEEILFQISSEPGAVTLIALGPLTNIAEAIRRERATMALTREIVLMGGAVTVPGNVTPAAEFNIFVDPAAARIVFDSGIPITLVGLDVTRKVRLSREDLDRRISTCETETNRLVRDSTRDLFVISEEREGEAAFSLHDPLAVGVAIDPSFVSRTPLPVQIETRGEVTEGMTVADRRPVRADLKKRPNAEVCLDVDSSRFLSFFLERLCGE